MNLKKSLDFIANASETLENDLKKKQIIEYIY